MLRQLGNSWVHLEACVEEGMCTPVWVLHGQIKVKSLQQDVLAHQDLLPELPKLLPISF